jgi:hypothetical protein
MAKKATNETCPACGLVFNFEFLDTCQGVMVTVEGPAGGHKPLVVHSPHYSEEIDRIKSWLARESIGEPNCRRGIVEFIFKRARQISDGIR